VVAKSVTQMIAHHPGVVVGGDASSVHQFRVATRRLRSDLRTFAPLLDDHWPDELRDGLAWLGGEIGRVRDVDVMADRVRSQQKQLTEDDARSANELLEQLAEDRSAAVRSVVAAVSSDRYIALLNSLVDAVAAPHFRHGVADDRHAKRTTRRLVRKPWRHLRRAVDALTADAPDHVLHRVRILSKRARYAAESVQRLHGRDARRFADAITSIQTVLGRHHDSVVLEEWLRETSSRRPALGLAAGQLIALERADRMQLRAKFERAWKKASRRNLRTWLR
jgi:CHAD domain-containing protein